MAARPLVPLASALILALALAAGGCSAAQDAQAERASPHPTLGLMTTLPILWGEEDDFAARLSASAAPHWARAALDEEFELVAFDALEAAKLAGLARIVLAQPRPLSGQENVALDAWVRQGGQLLLFADPMLTAHSRFPIGDRRRPQDVVLLSPILRHWGVELAFDPDQPEGERAVDLGGVSAPVDLAGQLSVADGSGCAVRAGGVLAECRIGKGRVVIFADAALLAEAEAGDEPSRKMALSALIERAFRLR